MTKLRAVILSIMLLALPALAGDARSDIDSMMARAKGCAHWGYFIHEQSIYQEFRCGDGARITMPRPDLKRIPRPFTSSWREWPDEVTI